MGEVKKEMLIHVNLLRSDLKRIRVTSLLQWVGMLALLLTVMLPINSYSAEHGNEHGSDSVDMGSVVVTAERIRDYAAENPNQVVVLDQAEITSRNMLSVDEALGTIAGVDVKPSSGAGSRISIRGSGKSGGVLVLLNGRPLNSSQYGGVDLSFISIDTVVSITVFKPPVPVWLGPGAVDGAISIITRSGGPQWCRQKRQRCQARDPDPGGRWLLRIGRGQCQSPGRYGCRYIHGHSGRQPSGRQTAEQRSPKRQRHGAIGTNPWPTAGGWRSMRVCTPRNMVPRAQWTTPPRTPGNPMKKPCWTGA